MKNRAFMKKALLAAILSAALSAFMGCDDGSKDPETYTVTYNANGGSGNAPSAQTVNAGSSVTVAGQGSLTYSGKTFNGWNTNSSGAGTAYAAGASLTVTGNITLYAQWGTAESANTKNITVYMEKPNAWSQLYAYVWDDGGTVYSDDAPGTALTAKNANGYYSFQANQAEYGYINVRFSDGSASSSIDILGVEDDTYYKSAGTYLAGVPSCCCGRAARRLFQQLPCSRQAK